MNSSLQSLILQALSDLAGYSKIKGLENPGPETRLYGAKSPLDSLALVNLISDIESRVADEFDVEIILADERAFDSRLTPFARVSTLTPYVEQLIKEAQAS